MISEQFNAYYYSFNATGNPGVDGVLRAVAKAGKAYHHTERWADDYDEDGPTQVDLIQSAADKAAADAEAAIAEAERRVRSECIQDGVPYTWDQGEVDLFRWQGQRDMLAKCIEAVQQALDKFWEESDADELGWREQHELYVDALRALEEKP